MLNVFNMDTNDEWKRRRAKFRHPFSSSTLRAFSSDVKVLVDRLCQKVDAVAQLQGTVAMDTLFGQLAMDAVCRIAFSYDLNALQDSEEFRFAFDNLQGVLEVGVLCIIRGESSQLIHLVGPSWHCHPRHIIPQGLELLLVDIQTLLPVERQSR